MYIATDKQKLPISILVLFFTVGGIVVASTFVDVLFLSTYPASWLPYLFVGKTVTLLVFTFLVGQQIAKGLRTINGAMIAIAAITILASRLLLDLDIKFFPFALSLWLDVIAVLAGVIAFSAVNEVFDLRQMKAFGQWIYATGGLGGLVFGLSVPFFMEVMNVNDLLYIMTLAFGLAAIGLATLQPLPASVRESQQSARPTRYPLFMLTALAFVLLLIVDTFADYALKREVAAAYDKEAIGSFMGPFYGITNAVTVVFQMTVVGFVMKRFGVFGLLFAVPIFGVVAAVGIWLAPGLWAAAGFRMGETILRRGFDDFGRSLVINPLPGQVRRAARLIWNGICAPIGTGIAALLLFFVSGDSALQGVAVLTFVISIGWLAVVMTMRHSYHRTLDDALRSGIFNIDEEALNDNPELVVDLVKRSLTSNNDNEVQFGLELITQHEVPAPRELAFFLGAEAQSLRSAAVNTIQVRRDSSFTAVLLERLDVEPVPEIRLQLFETLAVTDPQNAASRADKFIDSPLPEDRAGAAIVLLRSGSLSDVERATAVLSNMIEAPDARARRSVAHALAYLESGTTLEELRTLLKDKSESVREATLAAIGARRESSLIPEIIEYLGQGRTSFAASNALASIGQPAISKLITAANGGDFSISRSAIRALGRIHHPETEHAFTSIDDNHPAQSASVAAEASKYALRFQAGETLKSHAREEVLQTEQEIRLLNEKLAEEPPAPVETETTARLELAKRKLLHWLATASNTSQVLDVMPLIVNREAPPTDRAMAIELLETSTHDHAVRQAITVLEPTPALPLSTGTLDDPWLEQVEQLITQEGDTMDSMQTVVLLRRSPLFEELSGEELHAIAEVSELREMTSGETIYREGDYPDGLYIVASGSVHGVQDDRKYEQTDVFGDFELLDDSPRLSDMVASTDGSLILINKQTFEGITEDIPAVLRALTKRVVTSLRASLTE